MKKRAGLLLVLFLAMFTIAGCSVSMKYGSGNVETGENIYLFTRVTDIPEGWSESRYQTYYYEVDTKIVYVGGNGLSSNNSYIVELKSKEYRNYVYDEENNTFVGVK